MATIIRVKRKRNVDPAESLLIYCKRSKCDKDSSVYVKSDIPDTEVLFNSIVKFAGTISPSDKEPVSSHIRRAINSYKQQDSSRRGVVNVINKSRLHQRVASKENRYKLIAGRRVGTLEQLDTVRIDVCEHEAQSCGQTVCPDTDSRVCESRAVDSVSQTVYTPNDDSHLSKSCSVDVSPNTPDAADRLTDRGHKEVTQENRVSVTDSPGKAGSTLHSHEPFSFVDIEHQPNYIISCLLDDETDVTQTSPSSFNQSSICSDSNDQSADHDEFVYDLYLTHHNIDLSKLDVTNLCIEPLDELANGELSQGYAETYDDEDDSNDEDNWRNDYPDEDDSLLYGEGSERSREGSSGDNSDGYTFHRTCIDRDDTSEPLSRYVTSACRIQDSDIESDDS